MGILELMRERRIYFDGGMGSLLQARGLKPGELPETWNLSRPEIITEIHREYLDAGSDVVTTNTFGANHFKFKAEDGYSVKEIVTAAVRNAKNAIAAAGHGYAAMDMGPTGKLLKPYGDLEFEDAYEAYKEVVLIGKEAGADLVIIETMGDGYELKAAVLAAKENSDLPIFATVTLDEKGKMLTGGNVESVTALLEGLGADVIGLNCGLGPIQLLPFMRDMAKVSSTPILVNPNAGLPRSEGGKTVYDIDADEFAAAMQDMARNGATVLGGCCGTTPEHIHKTKLACDDIPVCEITDKNRTVISSYSHAVTFGGRPILIGERINPTGKPKFKQALKDKDLTYILSMGVAQQESRADVLDVNVGLPGIDEPQMMVDVVKELRKQLLPAVNAYMSEVANTAASKLAVSESISVRSETKTLGRLSADADAMSDAIDTLQDAVDAAKALPSESEKAVAFHDNVLPAMDALRAAADDAETVCGEDYWPLPSYSKMLYYV